MINLSCFLQKPKLFLCLGIFEDLHEEPFIMNKTEHKYIPSRSLFTSVCQESAKEQKVHRVYLQDVSAGLRNCFGFLTRFWERSGCAYNCTAAQRVILNVGWTRPIIICVHESRLNVHARCCMFNLLRARQNNSAIYKLPTTKCDWPCYEH